MVIAAIVVAVLLIGGVAFAVLSGGSGEEAAPPPASTNVDLKPGEVTVEWPGFGPSPITEGVPDQVMAAIGQYVDQGIVPALRGKKVNAAKLGDAFDEAAIARLSAANTPDRDALFDEGVPKTIGKLTIKADDVKMTALNDRDNNTLVVSGVFDAKATGKNAKGKFTVTRSGELVLSPDAAGTWKITGWTMSVTREGAGFPAGTADTLPETSTTSTTAETQ